MIHRDSKGRFCKALYSIKGYKGFEQVLNKLE